MKRLAVLPGAMLAAACSQAPKLHVYTWSNYFDPAVIAQFEQQTHCRVVLDTFASNEELLAKLKNVKASRQLYDVLTPSDYMTAIMIEEGLLEPLPETAAPGAPLPGGQGPLERQRRVGPGALGRPLPQKPGFSNWHFVNKDYTGLAFDPRNAYSVPYLAGMTGLAWDEERLPLKEDEISWRLLLDPALKNQTSLLNDAREAFAVALKLQGRSVNETNPTSLKQAAQALAAIKKQVKTITTDNFEQLLANGELMLAHAYNNNILMLQKQKPSLRFAIPKEGGVVWLDNMVIAKGSPHKDLALRFINFMLEPETAKANALFTQIATTNQEAWKLLPQEWRQNPARQPPSAWLGNKLEWLNHLGSQTNILYAQLWLDIINE